jgi:hypothetical protein
VLTSSRLNLRQHTLVKWTGAICVVGYITTIAVFLTHCHPIHRTWQVYPYPGDDCALNISKYYALVVTNIVYVSPPQNSMPLLTIPKHRYDDPLHPPPNPLERAAPRPQKAPFRLLALHRPIHHGRHAPPLHLMFTRRIPNQRRNHMVDPRNRTPCPFHPNHLVSTNNLSPVRRHPSRKPPRHQTLRNPPNPAHHKILRRHLQQPDAR